LSESPADNNSTPEDQATSPPAVWNFPAAVAAWLIPGMGHILAGHAKRGTILLVCIGGLYLVGLLVGGISVVHSRNADGTLRPWYLGQALIAPSLAVEYTHDNLRARTEGADPSPYDEDIAFSPAYGRAAEVGTLYTALAGLLNLLAIIDIAYREPRSADHALPLGAGEESGASL